VDLPLGVHNIKLQVSDGRGGEATDELVIGVVNRPPVVSAGGPYTGFEGTPLSFSASAADADHDLLAYGWNLGDGTTGTGAALPTSHTYADNGSYTASFSAHDGYGGGDAQSATISIANVPPSVRAGADATVTSGSVFSFSGGFSDRGVNDNPWSWRLAWGEGSPATGTSSSQAALIEAQHRYLRAGTYRVELSVTDKDGGAAVASAIVTVRPLTVPLDALPFIAGRPRTVYYNARKPVLSEPVVIAILGAADFAPVDPVTRRATINLASVRLGGVPVATLPFAVAGALNGLYVAGPADVNRDGRLDLLLTFQTDRLVQAGSLNALITTPQTLTLVGEHIDGREFTGTQQITVVVIPR
jgi:PKD repeat protein